MKVSFSSLQPVSFATLRPLKLFSWRGIVPSISFPDISKVFSTGAKRSSVVSLGHRFATNLASEGAEKHMILMFSQSFKLKLSRLPHDRGGGICDERVVRSAQVVGRAYKRSSL